MEAGARDEQGPRSTRSLRRALVLAVVLVAAVAAVLVLTAGKSDSDYEVTAEFTNASQLVKGNEVEVGGTAVGTRQRHLARATTATALVKLTIYDDYAPLRRGRSRRSARSRSRASPTATCS